jgi:ATP-binding cassette, subfamily B, bacterial PglK
VYKKFKIISDNRDRINLFILFILLLFSTFIEMLGISSIPIFASIVVDPNLIFGKIPLTYNFDYILNLDKKTLTLYASIGIFIIFLIKNIYLGFLSYFNGIIIKRIRSNLYNKMFKNYIESDYEFHIRRNSADLVRNITSEVSKAVYYVMGYILLIKESLIMIMIFFLLIYADTYVSIFIFSILGFFSFLFFIFTRSGSKIRGQKIQDYWGKQIKALNHGIGSIKQVKILNKEKFMFDIFKFNTEIIEKYNFIQSFIVTLPRFFLEVITISAVVIISIIFVNSDREMENFVPLIALIAVSGVRLIPSFNTISSSIATIKYQLPSFELIIRELKEMKVQEKKLYNNKDLKKKIYFNDSIEINNLTYSYPGTNKIILNDISLKINKGEIIGLSGESGEGKSTFLDLISGLSKPSKGKILVDGVNIHNDEINWQHQVGYVPQDIYLLDDTVKANIAFGENMDHFNKERFDKSVSMAQLSDFIESLPNKENAFVGDRGIRLSGGQKQRIGIARSLYFEPKILILDEPTSSLDVKNESLILEDVYNLSGNITIIIISHRMSAFKNCNKIYSLKNSKLTKI